MISMNISNVLTRGTVQSSRFLPMFLVDKLSLEDLKMKAAFLTNPAVHIYQS